MKFRTNREREERKRKKAVEIIDNKKKQIHTSFHKKNSYSSILSSVKQKISYWVIRNAHARKNIERLVLMPKIFFTGGTYKREKEV